jgi:polysaccharide export outer membrane protein
MCPPTSRAAQVCAVAVLFCGLTRAAAAQQPAANAPTSPAPVASTAGAVTSAAAPEDRYRIGPGDVLDIRVFNKPQFSRDGVRVDGRGMIRMPLIEGEIQAACRTEYELASDITARYKEYLRLPQVDVFIKDFQSQPVAVLGAVRAPSRFQLQRRVRLLDLLSYVGGPADNAGRTVQIVHTASPTVCEAGAVAVASETAASILDSFKLSETLRGDESANPYVRPGDVISIPEAEQAYIVGNVLKPMAISLKERVTISRAVAMSGGLLPDTKSTRVRIVRQAPDSLIKAELYVDLKAVDKHEAEDVVLQAGDIVDVPTAGGRRLLRSLVGAVIPAVGQLPVRVIP